MASGSRRASACSPSASGWPRPGVGAAIGLAAEHVAVGRRRSEPTGGEGDEPDGYGTLHGRAEVVHASDGTPLHVEVDEPDPAGAGRGRDGAEPTLVFSHGYA